MINKVILVGNLGKDPEVNEVGGSKVAKFSLATTKKWKDKDGNQQSKTTWHNIVCWRSLAEIVGKYLKKGDPVYIEGEIDNRSYEKDGETKYISEVVANEMKMLGGKKESAAPTPPHTSPAEESDNLPF